MTDQVERSVGDRSQTSVETSSVAVGADVISEHWSRVERRDEVDRFRPVFTLSHVTASGQQHVQQAQLLAVVHWSTEKVARHPL